MEKTEVKLKLSTKQKTGERLISKHMIQKEQFTLKNV